MSYNPFTREPSVPCNARLVIPTSFEACLSYEQQVNFLARKIAELEARVTALEAEVEPNSET